MSDTEEDWAAYMGVSEERQAALMAVIDANNGSHANEANNTSEEDVEAATSKLLSVSIVDSLRGISAQADCAVETELKSKGFSDVEIGMLKNKALREKKSLLQYTIKLCTVEQKETSRSTSQEDDSSRPPTEHEQDRGNDISI